jgi:DNA-binding LacI/PurR family transcriptional regulator
MPTLQTLADNAGVGRLTMWKAVCALAQQKAVIVRRGSGIVLAGGEDGGGEKKAWQHIADQLAAGVYNGEYASGAKLPPQSKLQLRLNANYRTVHKALSLLVHRKVLVRAGAAYQVPRLHSSDSAFEAILFTEELAETNERQRTLLQFSEQQAQKMGVRLIKHTHNLDNPFNVMDLKKAISRDIVSGFIVDYWEGGAAERMRNLAVLLMALYSAGKPLALIDNVGDLVLPEPLRSSKRVWILTIAAHMAGEEIGRLLLRLGHRRAAFFTIRKNEVWSQRRYNGCVQAFRDAGFSDTDVELFASESLPSTTTLVCAAAQLSLDEIKAFFPERPPQELALLSSAAEKTADMLRLTRPAIARIRRQVQSVMNFFTTRGDRFLAHPLRDNLFIQVGGRLQFHMLQPLLQKVARNPATTAWIGATDGTGLAASAFLRERSIDVPARISVCSFDNMLAAAMSNLTSYDFDVSGIFNQALAIATGRTDKRLQKQRIIEWPGQLIVRKTTGPAPRSLV